VLEILGERGVGGVERSVLNLAKELRKNNVQLSFLCESDTSFTGELRERGYDVFVSRFSEVPKDSVATILDLISQKIRPDVIHAHLRSGQLLAAQAGARRNTPVLVTAHSKHCSRAELNTAKMTRQHVTAVCRSAYEQCLGSGLERNRVSLIPNGVDTHRFRDRLCGKFFREEIGVGADALLVGFVGRLAWEKGPDIFLRIAQTLIELDNRIHCVFVGDGPESSALQQRNAAFRKRDRITFAGWRDRPDQAYAAMDVFVQTSRSEGTPLALLEAMACGVPVVALGVGGVNDVIQHGVSGFCVPPAKRQGPDHEALAKLTIELLRSAHLRTCFGAEARKRVQKNYDLTRVGRLTAELMRKMVRSNTFEHAPRDASWSSASLLIGS
jgi:glycosyltransferase involved in cell wall biosynthesis